MATGIAGKLQYRVGARHGEVSFIAHLPKFDATVQLIQGCDAPHFLFGKIFPKVWHVHSEGLGGCRVVFRYSTFLRHGQFLNIEDRFAGFAIQHKYLGTLGGYQYCLDLLAIGTR